MYKLTAINLEKIDCPVIITAPDMKRQSFKNGSELAASKFEHKYMIKTVRAIRTVHQLNGDVEAYKDFGFCIEISLAVPDANGAVSENDDVSFF